MEGRGEGGKGEKNSKILVLRIKQGNHYVQSRVWTPILEASPENHAFSTLGTVLKGTIPRHKLT